MTRRTFGGLIGGAAVSSMGQAAPAPRCYRMQTFYLRQGTQLARLHEYLSSSLPNQTPALVLEAIVAAHLPQVVLILPNGTLEQAVFTPRGEAVAKWESGEEAPYEHYSLSILEPTAYSPLLEFPEKRPEKPRIFELRTYHSPTWRQLAALHERFAGPEIKIFHRVGVHPILYTQTIAGGNMPNLTYVIPFESLAAREKAWDAFAADPEWIKVRKESIERSGQIASINQISLFRPASYSPIR
ncbi:MAG: NIPSNAP family protein [Bryobacteraceae bacterium]|nr:NIPSNAP family protein [Bryobacteraceae bacterium]